jgi:hypothetical protein
MGKRSSFDRRERDFYPTPPEAVAPLLPHLPPRVRFAEPCDGEGDLRHELERWGAVAVSWTDLAEGKDARDWNEHDLAYGEPDYFITNPPWPKAKGEPTLSIAKHLAQLRPTWLLLSADFAHNRYFASVAPICAKIVSVGRVSWAGNGIAGKDNCAWYLFDARHIGPTKFYGRAANG